MISVQEAKRILSDSVPRGPVTRISLAHSLGLILAEDVLSPTDSPRFHSSAMDGYAVNGLDLHSWKVIETVAAGDIPSRPLLTGEAMRIMTGALIPEGAETIIPQEEAELQSSTPSFVRRGKGEVELRPGMHIRKRGEELREGDMALVAGTVLNPAAIGFLASLGITDISVIAPPRVTLLPTGNELVQSPRDLAPGKIIETSSRSLTAAFQRHHLELQSLPSALDRPAELTESMTTALGTTDILLIAGGVSVGEFDFVKDVLAKLEFETLFWGVSQKPGKPLYFGRRGKQLVFGLPGNPASSLVCCYEYVVPAVRHWMGRTDIWPREDRAQLLEPFAKQDGKTHFVRARAEKQNEGWCVSYARLQGSHMMKSFAEANCLMVVPAEAQAIAPGDNVTIHWLE